MKKVEFKEAYRRTSKNNKVVLAATKKENGEYNLITLEWFTKTSINPPMYSISIGHQRYSYECLQKATHFNLIFPSSKLIELTRLSGSKSGKDINKLEGQNFFISNYSKLPILREAFAVYECKIVNQIKTGDHTIYTGEVKKTWLNNELDFITTNDLRKK